MPRKRDIQEVEIIAAELEMTRKQRFEFGAYLEHGKSIGDGGTKNSRGDFTMSELRQMAREFLNEDDQ